MSYFQLHDVILPAMSLGDRFCVSRKDGTGGGGCTRRVQTAWTCLGSAVERSWLAPGGPFPGIVFGIYWT